MGCMKCGKDVTARQVFCQECLQTMQQYPVKRDAVVQIPKRPNSASERSVPVRGAPSAATIRRQRGVIRVLLAAVILLAILLTVTAGMLLHTLYTAPTGELVPSQKNVATTQQTTATTQNPI